MPTNTPIAVIGAGLPGNEARLMELAPVREAGVLAAGKSLLAALKHPTAELLPIGADIAGLLRLLAAKRAEGKRPAVICSGDPLFFGLGARLLEHFGADSLRFFLAPGTLSAVAALCGLNTQDIRPVSLHGGRARLPLAHALLEGGPVLALTDAASDPAAVAGFLLERGLRGWSLHVLENIRLDERGAVVAGRRSRLSLGEAAGAVFDPAAQRVLVFLPEGYPAAPPFARGVARPDAAYASAGGPITKSAARACALALLGVEERDVVWDLGAGTGAVGIEAAGLARRGLVAAVEARPERAELIRENRARFQVPHLEVLEARLPDVLPAGPERCGAVDLPLEQGPGGPLLPRPQRVFIGGGLGAADGAGAAEETLRRAWACLPPGGRLVVSCVLLGTLERTRRFFTGRGIACGLEAVQTHRGVPLAGDLHLAPENPVFFLHATKENDA